MKRKKKPLNDFLGCPDIDKQVFDFTLSSNIKTRRY
jgi:hypothetical protein